MLDLLLEHHHVILVLQVVAVEHVGAVAAARARARLRREDRRRILGPVVIERIFTRTVDAAGTQHGVLPTDLRRRGAEHAARIRVGADVQDLELDQVLMERVRHDRIPCSRSTTSRSHRASSS